MILILHCRANKKETWNNLCVMEWKTSYVTFDVLGRFSTAAVSCYFWLQWMNHGISSLSELFAKFASHSLRVVHSPLLKRTRFHEKFWYLLFNLVLYFCRSMFGANNNHIICACWYFDIVYSDQQFQILLTLNILPELIIKFIAIFSKG